MVKFQMLLKLIYHLSFFSILLGMLISFFLKIKEKRFYQALLIVVIPFYVFYYLLKMKDCLTKKYLSILTIGSFIVLVFVNLFLLLLTPNL